MSNTYDICCDTCEKKYWFGQHSKELGHSMIYSTDHLGKFLTEHKEHELYVMDEHTDENEFLKRIHYENEEDE